MRRRVENGLEKGPGKNQTKKAISRIDFPKYLPNFVARFENRVSVGCRNKVKSLIFNGTGL